MFGSSVARWHCTQESPRFTHTHTLTHVLSHTLSPVLTFLHLLCWLFWCTFSPFGSRSKLVGFEFVVGLLAFIVMIVVVGILTSNLKKVCSAAELVFVCE